MVPYHIKGSQDLEIMLMIGGMLGVMVLSMTDYCHLGHVTEAELLLIDRQNITLRHQGLIEFLNSCSANNVLISLLSLGGMMNGKHSG